MFRVLVCLCAAAVLAGCAADAPGASPESALELYVTGLTSGDPGVTWHALAPSVQDAYHAAVESMRETDRLVVGLQRAEQADVRARGGLDRLEQFPDGQALYAALLRADAIPSAESYIDGASPRDVVEEGDQATLQTRAGQTFTAVRGPDGLWRIEEPLLSVALARLAQVHANRTNLRDTVALFGGNLDPYEELVRYGVAPARDEGSGDSAAE